MGRNLDRRIEVVVPVHDPELQARLFEVLHLVFADETNAWELGPDRRWRRVPNRHGLSSQERLKELARERARRRLESDLRVAEGDEAKSPDVDNLAGARCTVGAGRRYHPAQWRRMHWLCACAPPRRPGAGPGPSSRPPRRSSGSPCSRSSTSSSI